MGMENPQNWMDLMHGFDGFDRFKRCHGWMDGMNGKRWLVLSLLLFTSANAMSKSKSI